MKYKQTVLSSEDKEILAEIYTQLESIHIPTSFGLKGKGHYHCMKTGTTSQRDARQTSFGITTYRGKKQQSKSTLRYPHMMPLFQDFIDSHYPDFNFKSVYVNKNTIAKKHLDRKNSGVSLLVGFGPYIGGKTVLYDQVGPLKKFDINIQSIVFNGSEIEHESEVFVGTRYSMVFFK